MKVNNIKKRIGNWMMGAAILSCSAMYSSLFTSCVEDIDDSSLYTFTGEMMIDHFENDKNTFGSYLTLLEKVHPSKKSASTMKELLSARGNYTCFAPTNAAIAQFLDSLYQDGTIPSNQLDEIPDSLAQAIVFNSIIENGSDEAYATTSFSEGALQATNMNDRYINISYGNKANISENGDTSSISTVIYVNINSSVIDADIEVENGYIHAIDKVLSPSNASIADIIMNTENTKFFGSLLQMTGLDMQMQDYKDQAWEDKHDDIRGEKCELKSGWPGKYPLNRYTGYTTFVETDSVFQANGIYDLKSLRDYVKAHAYYDDDANQSLGITTDWDSDNYSDPSNWLYQFVSYHILPERLTYNNMITFANEYGCDAATLKTRTPNQFYINVWEYWETMGVQRRTLKITGIRGGRRINRISVYNPSNCRERSAEMTQLGININSTNGQYDNNALNGYYYPIDEILIWSQDVPTKVLNERMRYDITSLFPEFLTNNIRQNRDAEKCGSGYWYFTDDYLKNVVAMSNETKFIYLPNQGYSGSTGSWMNYQIDEFNINGIFDFTMKLPPVPYTGTYELRYGINANDNRGMAQVYIGKNPNNLPAVGIPLDLRASSGTATSATGWVADDATNEDMNRENDKAMRNLGFMKGPKYIQLSNGTGRSDSRFLRKIIYTGQFEAGQTYYIRFKSVLAGQNYEFFYDYLEFVPKSIYAGDEAEDIW